jgi:transposase
MGAVCLARVANLAERVERLAADPEAAAKTDEEPRRLCTIPEIGRATAGAVAAFVPDLDTEAARPV